MTTHEAMAVLRLNQWTRYRELLRTGRGVNLQRSGWVERRTRQHDAKLVYVIDFERALGALDPRDQLILLLHYRERNTHHETAQIMACSDRWEHVNLSAARLNLADELDRRGLL